MTLPVKWKILLIDDDEDIRDIMVVTLEDAGYEVICAPDGYSGLRLAEREDPQIIVTDIKMPGMDGLQVLETIKKIRPEIEVIVTTGFSDVKKAVRALQHDASDFISKPIDDDALHTALKRARQRFTDKKQLSDYTLLLEKENLKTSSELIKSVEFQSSLIEHSMDGILGCDENDIIVTYNRSMEVLLGYPKAKILKKKKVSGLFRPEQITKLKQVLMGPDVGGEKRLSAYETFMVSADNNDIPVLISGFVLSQDRIRDCLVLFISDLRAIRDLEKQKADQAKMLHREKMISLGRLAASMVHEINNPLSGILNYIRLMIRIMGKTTPLKPEQIKTFSSYLEIVESETRRCSGLVSGLLKFSRKSDLEQKSIDITTLINHSLLLCSHKLELSRIALEKNCETNIPTVYGDFNQLEQCVINLLFNAMDAMENGGVLNIQAGFDPEEHVVFISIKDNGKGIPEENIGLIFEPFFTTKNEGYGVGLGLSSAYGIIEKHRGTIVVKSVLDMGSEFIIKLPPEKTQERRTDR